VRGLALLTGARPMRLPRILPALLLPALLCGCGPKGEEEPVWVGCVAAFGGGDASAGVHLRRGVELAADGAAAERVEGRRPAVVAADDGGSDETAAAEAVRLLTVNRVAGLIGGADPGRALGLARAAQPYGAPVVLPCDVAGPLPGDAAFTLGVRPGWRGQVLARYAADGLKAKRAFVLTDERDPVAVAVAAGFVREWPRGEGAAVEEATYQAEADQEARAARAAAAKPDVVLLATSAADFAKARTRLETGGPHTPLLYGGEDAAAASLGGGDVVTATVFALDELTAKGQEFAGNYEKRFHEAPDLPACQGYDAARLLFDAMARAKTAASDKVRGELAATADFESATGPLRMTGGRARRPLFVVALHDGEAKVVQKVEPEPDAAADARP
jgi:branched-chain amino acid transport system substrate-binding protein